VVPFPPPPGTGEGQGGGGEKALPDRLTTPFPTFPRQGGRRKPVTGLGPGAALRRKEKPSMGVIQIAIGIAIEIEIPWDRQTSQVPRTVSPQAMRKTA